LRKVGPYRKLHVLLDALEAAHIPVVLCSDYPVRAKAQALGLEGRPWRAMLDAASQGGLKPRPEVFLAAAQALGCAPARVLHVGDSPWLDVEGAASVGMQTALVGRKWKDGAVSPTWRVRHMNLLCEQVAQALGTR
jgi:putative hydrolase of the HAD superfamily